MKAGESDMVVEAEVKQEDSVEALVATAPTAEPEAPAQAAEPEKVEDAPAPAASEPEPAKVEEPPAPTGPSLTIEFDTGAETGKKEVTFTEGTLGIVFRNSSPVTVEAVVEDGVADKAGVRKGWIFTKIGGEPLEGKDYQNVMTVLKNAIEPLPKVADSIPAGAVVIEFTASEGRVRRVGFTQKPLGITFDSNAPQKCKAVKAGSIAEQQGVKAEWIFRTIAGKNVTNLAYKEMLEHISKSMQDLPQA
jgi:hypothetical protein